MMSFGVVKCDGGGVRQEQMLKQKIVIKKDEQMEEGGLRRDNINDYDCQKVSSGPRIKSL